MITHIQTAVWLCQCSARLLEPESMGLVGAFQTAVICESLEVSPCLAMNHLSLTSTPHAKASSL